MLGVGKKVELLKNIDFDYGRVANKGQVFTIYKIDLEGFWLKEIDVYIEHGYENEYLRAI